MLFSRKIAFIGSGNMGEALLGGLLKAELTNPENIIATDIRQYRLDEISAKWKVTTTMDNHQAVQFADIIVLCVKPQALSSVLEEIKADIREDQLIISIIAGITTRTISRFIGVNNPVVRVMPNIPAVVDEAATGVCLGEFAQDVHKEIAMKILGAVGEVEAVPEELMDVVTGLSGSGPAYIYMIIEALTDGGVMMGLPRNIATRLATQTVLGSAKLVRETNVHPAVLKDQVTTPGGTTIQAIKELEESGLRPMLIRAVETATIRSRELSHFLEKTDNVD
ncbi:pyrroline-5-carboxylate reductase [candidate division KSB1 bacterium]|nr:pyrroline-5-carboxylate reductase [candidate division KSB1 bacterium]RQW00411.1 MAG: pyrroline-5-carboxylate reductase [candidate division KSB1 bacterium]